MATNLYDYEEYLTSLTDENDDPISQHQKNIGVVGIVAAIHSILKITHFLLYEEQYEEVFTDKFSQKHLKLWFKEIRALSSSQCKDPNTVQFKEAVKKYILQNNVTMDNSSSVSSDNSVTQNGVLTPDQRKRTNELVQENNHVDISPKKLKSNQLCATENTEQLEIKQNLDDDDLDMTFQHSDEEEVDQIGIKQELENHYTSDLGE